MLNHEDSVLISVHDGRSDRLKATGEQVLIKRAFLPDNFDSCCLQKSVAPGIFWMIIDGKRYQDQSTAASVTQFLTVVKGTSDRTKLITLK